MTDILDELETTQRKDEAISRGGSFDILDELEGVQPEQPQVQEATPEPVPEGGLFQRVAEPVATIASAAVAEPLSGLAGLTQLGRGIDPAVQAVEETREALTFQPRTQAGREGLEAVGKVFEPVGKAFGAAERFLGDIGFELAGPAGGAVGATIPTALMEVLSLASFKKVMKGKGGLIDDLGKPADELSDALKKSGVDFSDLDETALADLKGTPEQLTDALRRQRFEQKGIPATRADITQRFPEEAAEQRLISMASGEAGEPLRDLKIRQSKAFEEEFTNIIDGLGVPDEAGSTMKDALTGRKKLLSEEKNRLYREFAESSPEVQNTPIVTDSIVDVLPDPKLGRRIERLSPTNKRALDDLLVEFGVDQDPSKVDAFISAGDEITPLNIGNFDDFRQGINQIERADQSGAIKVLSGPIKEALDGEAALIDDAVKGFADESILAPLKEARKTVRQIKTEFSPQAITGKLVDVKRDGVTPVVEASKALDKVSGTVEDLQRTISSLNKAGEAGKKAIGDMQAATLMRALDDAFKAPSRKLEGGELIGFSQFDKSLAKFGDDKLNVLFANNKRALKDVQEFRQIAKDLQPSALATPKGSAPIILDALNRVGRVPGIAAVVDLTKFVINAGADERAVARAIKAKPRMQKTAKLVKEDFPSLAIALGVGIIDEDEE
jgi:hypothetical protein